MSSKLFCPMCISSGGSTSRKRRKGHRSSVDSVGSDNDDDNFYRPSKEALKSKTSSISTSDPDQPFHVPSIFKPIRVDSPALFVRGSSSTVSENRVGGGGSGKGDTGDLPDALASSSEEEIGYKSKAIGTSGDGDDDCTDDNNIVLGRGNGKGEKIKILAAQDSNEECEGDDSEVETCTGKQAEDEKKRRENDKMKQRARATAGTTMVSAHSHEKEWKRSSKDATNKADDISKSVGATSSPRTRKSLGLTHGGSPTIARARPRAGSDFRKKLKQPTTTPLPRSEELGADDDAPSSILNQTSSSLHQHESNDERADRNQQECCAYSLDSQSSRSLSVNYDSHCPDAEARQPLLFATSELDLVSDDEEDEDGDIMEEDQEEILVEEEEDEDDDDEGEEEEDERQQGFAPDTHATSQVIDNSPFQGEMEQKNKGKEKECVEQGDLDKSREKFSQVHQQKIVIPQIVTDSSGGNMGVVDVRENILLSAVRQEENPPSSINSSKSSTPAPPPLPECPPPDSESESWSRSGSNTRCPSRSGGGGGGGGSHFYFHFSSSHRNKRRSCSCGTSPARDQHQQHYSDHAGGTANTTTNTEDSGGGGGPTCSAGYECKGALSLVDMSQIHYADSASSCCGSDICDMGEGDNTITRLSTNNTAATATVKNNNNCIVHTSSPSCASSTFISKNTVFIAPTNGRTTAAVATNTNDDDDDFGSNNGCHSLSSCHPTPVVNDQIGNENRRYCDVGRDATTNLPVAADALPPSVSSSFPLQQHHYDHSGQAAEMDADKAGKSARSYVSPVIKKVSASVNTDIVMPPSYQLCTGDYNENDDGNIAMTVMALDRSDSQEELPSTSTTPTPPKYALGDNSNTAGGAEEMREFRLLPSLQQPLGQQQDSHSKRYSSSSSSSPRVLPAKAKGIRSSSVTITLMRTPRETQTEQDGMIASEENKELAESDPSMWSSVAERKNSAPERILTMTSYTAAKSGKGNEENEDGGDDNNDGNDNQPETRILAEGYYYSEMDLDLALQNKHMQASGKWHYPYHSTGHVPATDDPRTPLVLAAATRGIGGSGDDDEGGEYGEYEDPVMMIEEEEEEDEDEHTIEDLRPLISTAAAETNTTSVDAECGVDQSPQVHYRGVRTNVTGSWFSLSSSSSLEDYDEHELIMASSSGGEAAGRSSSSAAAILASAAANASISSFDPERWSPESSPSLSILSYEEILTEQQKIQQDVQRVVDAVKQQNFNKTDNIGDGGHALDLASQSNVQDAFVIAVEQQARERLEKLSALKKIKPVDMTKLSHQLSEAPSESGETSAELNGLIEAATGSPIYVTSASELNSSQSALHRTTVAAPAAGGTGTTTSEESEEGKPSPSLSTPTSTVTTRAVISSGPELSPSKRSGSNVTVVGVNTSTGSTSLGGTCLPNGQYSSGATTGDRSTESSVGEPVPAKKSISKESVNGSRKSGSRESITDSRESVQFEGAKPSPSRSSRGSASKLASQSSSRESVIEASSSSQYANMINMVEWDNGPHREMAVDVPESFVPRNKTPPRYPPTNKTTTLNSNNNKTAGKSVVSDGVGVRGNGAATLPGQNGAAGKPVPPPRIGDNKEGVYGVNNNTTQVPLVTPRTVIGQAKTAVTTPSRDEAERIRKYQEELKKRREQEEKHAKEEEFLRTSLRGSKKLQALESVREDRSFPTGEPKGFVNAAYDLDGDQISHPLHDITLQKPVGLPELVASLQRVQQALKKHGVQLDEAVSAVGTLMQTPEFQQVLAVHNKVQDVWCFNAPPNPVTAHAQQLNQECLESLYNCSSPASAELVEILSRIDMDGVLHAHDKIAERERLLMTAESPLNAGEPVDPVITSASTASVTPALPVVPAAAAVVAGSHMKSVPRPAFVPEPQPDDHIKVVRIEKTQDPLGATVRNDADAVVIGRIVKGGAAERSGLLHEGDEVLEVNGVEMRGKSVNEVCDILSRMTGTLTFLIVPTQVPQPPIQQRRDILIHVRAHFDYDPEDDIYIPCRELGVAFAKGDVLHVINQDDPSWWQAHREGEEDQQLAGLIPSKSFQEQREAVKQTLLGETETREKTKKGTLLCAKTHKKKKKKIPYSSAFNDGKEFDAEEIPTYEEVALYYPRTSFKRPVVLIGPPNIGRHELRQRLMQESERFAAAVPHTSRSRKDGEIDGQDYHFISRAQFESDILSRKFVEHGEFEKAYYGTSLDAIRSVVNAGKICVLNLHPQSLKILRSSDLKPYIVFIAPPPLERLKQMRIARGEAYKEDELIDIIEKAREMEEKYGHYFDLVIVNNDIERTYHELVQRINYIEREPQWVPAFWLKQ